MTFTFWKRYLPCGYIFKEDFVIMAFKNAMSFFHFLVTICQHLSHNATLFSIPQTRIGFVRLFFDLFRRTWLWFSFKSSVNYYIEESWKDLKFDLLNLQQKQLQCVDSAEWLSKTFCICYFYLCTYQTKVLSQIHWWFSFPSISSQGCWGCFRTSDKI